MLGRVWRNGDAVVIVVDPCFGVISYLYYISMLDIINIHIIIYYYWQYTYLCVMTIKCDPINPLLIQCITLISYAIYNLSHLKNRYDRINSIPCINIIIHKKSINIRHGHLSTTITIITYNQSLQCTIYINTNRNNCYSYFMRS